MVDRQPLNDHSAQRDAPGAGLLDAVGVQDANGVIGQVHRRVRRRVGG